MEQQQALESFMNLCDKMSQLIDVNTSRMKELEDKIKTLEMRQAVLYTQKQVAEITGWSVAAINTWVKTGFITGVPVSGKKNLSIPSSEITVILTKRGYGPKLKLKEAS